MGGLHRRAWLAAAEEGLTIGDPGREHVALSVDGIVHRAPSTVDGRLESVATWSWSDVAGIEVHADTTSKRRPGRTSFVVSALLEAIGWGSNLPSAPVTIEVHDHESGVTEILADGFTGKAYPAVDHEAALRVVSMLTTDRSSLPRLSRPDELLRIEAGPRS